MFGNKEKPDLPTPQQPRPTASSKRSDQTVLGEGASFNGTLDHQGDLVINGTIEGAVTCSGSLNIGKTGTVKGEIEAREALVSGRVEGTITARERVQLQTGSHVRGDVHADSFMIQEGVFFQGNCSMGDAKPAARIPTPKDGETKNLGMLKQA